MLATVVMTGLIAPAAADDSKAAPLSRTGESASGLDCSNFNMNEGLGVSDGNYKYIAPTGEFWVNGDLLGVGQWISPTRFVVLVERWGSIWWIGELYVDGMLTTTVRSEDELLSAQPAHYEPWTPAAEFAARGDVLINEGGHGKVIKPTGEFIVNGNQLGVGSWVSTTRFVVFVANWGNLWWVGELNSEGMVTGVADTEAEALALEPAHQELWTSHIRFARQADIVVSDGNHKVIRTNGDFVVNGYKLGRGRWVAPNRYAVFVESWGNRWWIGDLTTGGMVTTTVLSTADVAEEPAYHFEPYAFAPGELRELL